MYFSAQDRPVYGATRQAVKTAAIQQSQKPQTGDPVSEAAFAWRLFVHAVTPSQGALTFETWTEQCQLNPQMLGCPTVSSPAAKGKKVRTLHGSALGRKLMGATASVIQKGIECNAMTTGALGGYPAPSNLANGALFCEEVFVNPFEVPFVTSNGLTTLSGQQTYGKAHGGAITFPWSAIEIKADWVPPSSFSNPTFSCPDPTNTLYTETINGTCYALVGLHISSKILPDWVWATFEPNSAITNPNRCDPNLHNTCFDPWGTTTKTPYGKDPSVQQSPALQALMQSAGLHPAFNNYFLTGVQTQFVTSQGSAIPLGNSFVEFNAGVFPHQASCITCHKYAYNENGVFAPNFGGPPTGYPNVGYACNTGQTGNCIPPTGTTGWITEDFSWMLGLMPAKPASKK